MLKISEIVKKTEEMFDLFNEHFYENELTRPAITVSPDGGRRAYGWCSINEIRTPAVRNIGRSIFAPSISTDLSSSWPPRSYMKLYTFMTWYMRYRT